ncbi:MAG: putative DNA binding domain-containing protein [Phycisphaerae bacterium]|nr:putative DNA binding domain-containing protein [Phycisphaerae bacterium]MCZ2400103.1 putative DNA binding domain-containing protein [Phycisphaerae bacterium]
MTATLQQLQHWLTSHEDEHLEFKEAKSNFHFDKLVKYCAALANEGGGSIVLGVTDKRPRRVVGSSVFPELERTKAGLVERLRLRIDAQELAHADGRVVVFTAPSRPIGVPIAVEGAYWMRAGEDLAPMTPDMLRRIFDEAGPDFSAEVCREATLADLDPAAITAFRTRWARHSGSKGLAKRPVEALLQDAELILPAGLTYAALILLGTRAALGRFLAQAEVIFEYRANARPGPANQREEFRQGFFLFYDRVWELVNLRNDVQHFQERFVMHPVPTFSEVAVREALLNAVSHRDYRHAGSVFVRQYPRHIEIVSPGGFPPGITPDNILDQQLPRNRRIAETFARCGLVERSGQGADRIVEECVRHGKPLPDYSRSDDNQVWLTLDGEIRDEKFLKYLERVGEETLDTLDPHDFLLLSAVAEGKRLTADLRRHVPALLEKGLLDRIGRGKPILARKLYQPEGQATVTARTQRTTREQDKADILKHVKQHRKDGTTMEAILKAVPAVSRSTAKRLLDELRAEGKVHSRGEKRQARWYPGSGSAALARRVRS